MDKFFCDLEEVLEKYNHDVTALDDYEVTAFHSTKFCKDQETSFANNLCSLKTHQTHHQHWSDSVWKLSNQVEVDFVRSIITAHFNQLKTKVSQ